VKTNTNTYIKNWAKFQHFRDRKPPWIKLYRELLDDREWHSLDPKAAKTLVMLWLLASENEGSLPDEETIAFRLRIPVSEVKKDISKLSQWLIQGDISVISARYQVDTLETETETETEREQFCSPKPKRATRLALDWKPSTALLEFMKERRPDLDQDDVTLRFCNFWHSKAGASATKLDWDKTFQNWVLSENQGIRKPTSSTNLDAAAGRGGI
jgi:hypothetical protein